MSDLLSRAMSEASTSLLSLQYNTARTIENSKSDASTSKTLRNNLDYVRNFSITFLITNNTARIIENSKSEASTAKRLRKKPGYVGPIETSYVRSFENFPRSIEVPILGLRELGDFITDLTFTSQRKFNERK